jgi:flagellar assembly protein FliH
MATYDPSAGRAAVRRAVFVPIEPVRPAPPPVVPDPIVEHAAELERARLAAETDGFARGYARGQEQAQVAYQEQLARLRKLVDGVRNNLQDALNALEPQLIELAVVVAERIVERQLGADADLVARLVHSAVEAAAALPVLRVRVSPRDYPLLTKTWVDQTFSSVDAPELVEDASIEPGGCVVDTVSGFVDAQLSTRIAELRQQILASLEAPP